MAITKRNIRRHELIGLNASVTSSKNKADAEIKGKIINETQKSLVIRHGSTPKRVFKSNVKLEIKLPKEKVELDGNDIVGRPWERIKFK